MKEKEESRLFGITLQLVLVWWFQGNFLAHYGPLNIN